MVVPARATRRRSARARSDSAAARWRKEKKRDSVSTETTAGARAPLVREFFGQHDLGLVPELVRELVAPQALRPGRLAERRARRLGARQIRVTQKPKHLAQHVRGNSVEQHAWLVLLHHVLGGLRPHHASVRGPLPPGAGAHVARPARRVKLWPRQPAEKAQQRRSASARSRRSRAFRGCASLEKKQERIFAFVWLSSLPCLRRREFCADETTRKTDCDIRFGRVFGPNVFDQRFSKRASSPRFRSAVSRGALFRER